MAQILAMGNDGIVTGDAHRCWGNFPVEVHFGDRSFGVESITKRREAKLSRRESPFQI